MKRIFVLTGGGLSPTLNPTIYGVVKAAQEKGWLVFGGLYGWASLLKTGKHIPLHHFDIEPLKHVGGTILRSSRTNPLSLTDGIDQVKDRLLELEIDAVIAIGGNDTLGAAAELAEAGLPVIGVPKTIDNDLANTYFTPGFPSAAQRLAKVVREVKDDAAYALSRIFVVESLGMKAGWLAAAGALGGADIVLPPEKEIHLHSFLKLLNERYVANGNYAVVVVGQETRFDVPLATPTHTELGEQYGHTRNNFICLALKDVIQKDLGIPAKAVYPGNFLETGAPTPLDRDFAIALGEKAVDLAAENMFGRMTVIERPNPTTTDLIVGHTHLRRANDGRNYKAFPEEYFDYNTLLPTPAFFEYMRPLVPPISAGSQEYAALLAQVAQASL